MKDEEYVNRMPALEQSIPTVRERDKVRVQLPKLQIEKFSGIQNSIRHLEMRLI